MVVWLALIPRLLGFILHSLPFAVASLQVVLPWVTQCYWNFLDLPDISRYLCLLAVGGPHYAALLPVALLAQLQPVVLAACCRGQVEECLVRGPLPYSALDWTVLSRHMLSMLEQHPWVKDALPLG